MTDNQITINQIYELLSRQLENGLNSISEVLKFSIKTSYNYQEPSKSLTTIAGVMNFATNNVAPVQDLEAYTLPAIVSFCCVKEYANELMAILTKFISDNKGIVQEVGDYFAVPTYSTPSQGELQMVGQLGESIKITMYIEYAVYQDLIFTNDLKIKIDNNAILFNDFGLSKQKSCDSDSVENQQTLESVPLCQTLVYTINAFITSNISFLLDEVLSLEKLTQTHTLTLELKGNRHYSYEVVMNNSEVKGVVGGAILCAFTFSVADGRNGGLQDE